MSLQRQNEAWYDIVKQTNMVIYDIIKCTLRQGNVVEDNVIQLEHNAKNLELRSVV